jgi:drug/metabolite transporter (DMT)-like permease
MRASLLFYLPVGMAVISTILYHLTQRLTPVKANPPLALGVTYLTAMLLCLPLLLVFPLETGLAGELRKLNWASFGLALAILGLEVGFLLAYRVKWNISLLAIVVNASASLLLLPIGLVFFHERLTPLNIAGVLVCIAGLVMISLK